MGFFKRNAKYYYGLDVGNGAIKLVELRRNVKSNTLVLQRFLIKPTPLATLENGVVKHKSELQAVIKGMLRELGVRSLTVATVLTGQSLIVRHVDVPQMPEEEFRKGLQLQADRYFGIPATELAADFQIIHKLPQNQMHVLLVGSLKQPILDFVEFLYTCGIKANRVDIEPLAALRSLRMPGVLPAATADQITAVLDLGAGTSNLSIFQGDELRMVRVITVGGNDFTAAIVAAKQVDWQEAETMKFQHGVIPDSPVFFDLEHALQRLLRQISISLEYYQVEHRSQAVSQLRIIGGGSQTAGLIDAITATVADLFARLGLAPPIVAAGNPCCKLELADTAAGACEYGPILAVAIGLALGEVAADATL